MNQYLNIDEIELFIPAEGCRPVSILVAGNDEWDVKKAIDLIKASRQAYDALCSVSEFLHRCPNDGSDAAFDALLLQMDRAIAAACGAVLQRDRMVKHGS